MTLDKFMDCFFSSCCLKNQASGKKELSPLASNEMGMNRALAKFRAINKKDGGT